MCKYRFSIVLLSLGFLLMSQSVGAAPFQEGDVFAAIGDGKVEHYDAAGTFLETFDCGYGGYTTGMAFDSDSNLYVTEFSNTEITVFAGPGDPHTILGRFSTGDLGDQSCESIVFDAMWNFYVGHADGNGDIHKYNPAWTRLAVYDVARENRGSDWIDLAADQRTMFHTSEGRRVMRYDVVDDVQLTDFAVLPGSGTAYAHRILSDGGILVADWYEIKRLDSSGTVIQTYDVTGENSWFSLNLDPDRTSFWGGALATFKIYKFDIASGALLQTINTGQTSFALGGVTVFGEITAAMPEIVDFDIKPQSCPNPLNVRSGGVLPVAILGSADFDVCDIDPASISLEGVAPIRDYVQDVATPVVKEDSCDCTDEGPDGFDDFTFKFDKQEIVAALGAVNDGDILVLTITGELMDGTPIEGEDCVLIIKRGGGPQDAGVGILPLVFDLADNIPNPCTRFTLINYQLPSTVYATLKIYDASGRLVRTLVDEAKQAGYYAVSWDGKDNFGNDVNAGIYFYHINAGDFTEMKKMVLIR